MDSDQFDHTHPQRPDLTAAERLDWLRLFRSRRVGAVTFHRLIAGHCTAASALAALPAMAAEAGVKDYSICPPEVAAHEMSLGRLAGAVMLCWGDAAYPAALYDLPDAPPILWAIGDVALLNRPSVAMVGARNASSLGMRMANRLAETLGEKGFVVVSGLARGIDAAAHKAALSLGTVAVQAGGVDVIYPEENAVLAAQIGEQGCRISEQPMGLAPQARHFPMRNRLVSGLSQAVVVVEAAARSGSLITARNALDQGRDVLAVPGHPFDARAAGCNLLIREGAILVRSSSDVIEAIGTGVPQTRSAAPQPFAAPPMPIAAPRAMPDATPLHSQILARLGPSPMAEDQLIRDLALPSARITPELLTLELEGKVLRQAGGLLSRVG